MNRKSLIFKPLSIVMLSAFLFQIFYPTVSYALTSGPSQPETQSFMAADVSNMVDPFSGDFSYNIPLMEVGGYPINLSYSAGATMDQEASWVGLGWNINPGVISRNVRGLPDDFMGDKIKKEFYTKPNKTYGASGLVPIEVLGLDLTKKAFGLKVGLGASFNNYSGVGLDLQFHPSIGSSEKNKTKATASLGLSLGTSGVGISPSVSFTSRVDGTAKKGTNMSTRIGSSFNSRTGLQAITLSASMTDYDKVNNGSANMSLLGGRVSFASPTYTPTIQNSYFNKSFSLNLSFGTEAFATDLMIETSGYFSGQFLRDEVISSPSYGYLNYQEGVLRPDAVLDFNREKDIGYSPEVKNLPVTSATYDIFSVSGQGIGGSYRLFRNDVGSLYDNSNSNISGDISLGGPELGGGNLVRGGVNIAVNTSNSTGGRWRTGNSTYDKLQFRKKQASSDAEPVYFRKSGEKNVMSDENYFDDFGGFDAIAANLDNRTELLAAQQRFTKTNGASEVLRGNNLNEKRQARNEVITYFTAEEAEIYGVFDAQRQYTKNTFNLQTNGTYLTSSTDVFYTNSDAVTAKKKHHLSEIDVYSSDGRKYVYADPLYNYYKEEVTFATNNGLLDDNTVNYSNGKDNARKNGKGLDHYFNKVTTPAYPTAFLLSTILSSDYVDVDDIKGPSDEDLGNYTKFNYTTITSDFKWRTPYDAGQASLNTGFHTKTGAVAGDNKATYVYGTKDLKYLHSIETKTHVAEFILGDAQNEGEREDGFEVSSDYGGKGTNQTQVLRKIKLYSKQDKIKEANGQGTAIPIKTVHFKYYPNNSVQQLCKGIDNGTSGGGKLTLEKVYFTYGKSNRGRLAPYTFTYGQFMNLTNPVNPDYDTKAIDRWGNHQPNSGTPKNPEFPFTDQSLDASEVFYDADMRAASWNLTSIELPSGGKIRVDYEADDYAFVQDKKAMQMFKIKRFSNSAGTNATNELFQKNGGSYEHNTYLTIELPDNYPSNLNPEDFLRENGTLIQNLYFKSYINIEGESDKEYVFGYAEIDQSVLPTMGAGEMTFKLKAVGSDSRNPLSVTAFNFLKRHFPAIAYKSPKLEDSGPLAVFKALISAFESMKTLIVGLDDELEKRDIGKYVDLNKSWVRLYNPNGKKKGGGHRVKRITINDNWSEMAGGNNQDSEYGQEYDYTMQDAYGRIISSGVAAYEPILGNEENPLRQPRFYDKAKLMIPDEEFYLEEPMGEFFFPGASVGYREVTVRNLQHSNVTKNATGKTVKKFYTAYDFPTITGETPIKVTRKKPNSILKLLKLAGKDYVSTSQGYVVELNDMHGKPMAEWQYQENDDSPYSGVEYKYAKLSEKRIASKDLVIDKSGQIQKKYLGVEMDLVADIRQSKTTSISSSHNFNVDAFIAVIFPAIVPTYWPSYSSENVRYNSIVYNKVVKRHGLLKETIYYDQKSQIGKTNNLLRDAESGEVLLTQSVNAFEDPIYNFNYPAYWAYDQMGPVYKTADISIKSNMPYKLYEYLKIGDMVAINNPGVAPITAWVSSTDVSQVKYIDKDGVPVIPVYSGSIRIINPARSNQQAQTIGSIVSLENPLRDLNGDGMFDELSFKKVLQAGVTEYTEQASVFCNCDNEEEGTPYNPFVRGTKGIWKPWREFSYNTNRIQTRKNENINTRRDGYFEQFTTFWNKNEVAGQDWKPNYDDWIYTAEASIFNPYGKELESRDALGRYSSAIFGYKHALPTAVAKNARYQHVAFDGFEDYGTEACADDHFSYEQVAAPSKITSTEAHTGSNSINVSSNSSYNLRKVMVECEKKK